LQCSGSTAEMGGIEWGSQLNGIAKEAKCLVVFCAAVLRNAASVKIPFSIFICGILCLFWLRGKPATSLDGPTWQQIQLMKALEACFS
jgi:hypothetical protein